MGQEIPDDGMASGESGENTCVRELFKARSVAHFKRFYRGATARVPLEPAITESIPYFRSSQPALDRACGLICKCAARACPGGAFMTAASKLSQV
jgi:hypothetical protein